MSASTFIAVIGANKGFGRAAAELLAKACPGSDVVLTARSSAALDATAAAVEAHGCTVTRVTFDLDRSEDFVQRTHELVPARAYERAFVVASAGALEPQTAAAETDAAAAIQTAVNVNVTSFLHIVNHVGRVAKQFPEMKVHFANVSSKAAIAPFKFWSTYCSTKAARNMALRVLKEEQPDIVALNYAPGILDTDMQAAVRGAGGLDEDTRAFFQSVADDGKLIPPAASAAKMVFLLLNPDKAPDMMHTDYWDLDEAVMSS